MRSYYPDDHYRKKPMQKSGRPLIDIPRRVSDVSDVPLGYEELHFEKIFVLISLPQQ